MPFSQNDSVSHRDQSQRALVLAKLIRERQIHLAVVKANKNKVKK